MLIQDYACGVIDIALRVAPRFLEREHVAQIQRPLKHVRSPFPDAYEISDHDIDNVKGAFRIDFENYTIGRLVEGRRNYDDKHEAYRAIRRQIGWRVSNLGYSDDRFAEVDERIGRVSMHTRGERANIERYGKKYSWIAFFEMYGWRLRRGLLPKWHDDERPSDIDIDPSFPLPPRDWLPELDDPLNRGPEDIVDWVSGGPKPYYESILRLDEIDGVPGPWLLLDGYMDQRREDDDRSIFTFLRCLLGSPSELTQVLKEYDQQPYPGNHAIPEPICDTSTFAGEIPWSDRYAYPLRAQSGDSGRQMVRAFEVHGIKARDGVAIELPVTEFLWESSGDSSVNDVLTVRVPSPALCERLDLINHARQFDLYDTNGALASICISANQEDIHARLVYMREDLLLQYANETAQAFSWLVWGERTQRPGASDNLLDRIPQDVFSSYTNIHKQSYAWIGHAPVARIHSQEGENSSPRTELDRWGCRMALVLSLRTHIFGSRMVLAHRAPLEIKVEYR